MVIQGTYLIPDTATKILLPQHLTQQADDHYLKEEGTGALMTSKNIMLFWSQRRFSKTVPLVLESQKLEQSHRSSRVDQSYFGGARLGQ